MVLRNQGWKELLVKKIEKQSIESKQKIQEVAEKRSKRRKEEISSPKNEGVPNFFSKKEDNAENTSSLTLSIDNLQKRALKYNVVQEWFMVAMLRNNIDWVPTAVYEAYRDGQKKSDVYKNWWVAKDRACATRLLKLYGEKVEKAVNWYCDNWENMKESSCGRLTGAPTIGYLWACRDMIFPDALAGKPYVFKPKNVQAKKKKHMGGEYSEEMAKKSPKVGFRDEF